MTQEKKSDPKGKDEARRQGTKPGGAVVNVAAEQHVNKPAPDGGLSDRDLDAVAGAGLASIPVGNIIRKNQDGR